MKEACEGRRRLEKKWRRLERDRGVLKETEEASEGRRRSERDGGGLRKNAGGFRGTEKD